MRTVRSVINESLFIIGYNQDGQDVPDGFQFQRNFDRFQNVASQLRQEYPFNIQRILQFSELSNIPFVSIDSMVGSVDFSVNSVRYPMKVVQKNYYDQLTIHPITGGIPQYYYFEPPNQVFTFPTVLNEYEFAITGKLNESLTMQPDDSFNETDIVFINYLTWTLAEYYACVYQKDWTSRHELFLRKAKRSIEDNFKQDYALYCPEDISSIRIYRARNLIRGI